MSKLKLLGSTSGHTMLSAPASAGSNTLVLPPNNGSANQVLATDGNGNLTWVNNTVEQPNFKAYNNAGWDFDSGQSVIARINATAWDTHSGFDTSAYKYTIPTGQAGKWFFSCHLRFSENWDSTKDVRVYYLKNGSEWTLHLTNYHHNGGTVTLNDVMDLAVGDYIQIRLWNSYPSPTLEGHTYTNGRYSYFYGFRLSA